MREPQGGIARDRAGSVQDLGDAIGRYLDLAGKLRRAQPGIVKMLGALTGGALGAGIGEMEIDSSTTSQSATKW